MTTLSPRPILFPEAIFDAVQPTGAGGYAAGVLRALGELLPELRLDKSHDRGVEGPMVRLTLSGRPRLRPGEISVVAVHELEHLLQPRALGPWEWARQNLRTSWRVNRATHLVAPSEPIRDALTDLLRVRPNRITLVLAPPSGWLSRPDRGRAAAVLERLTAPARYFVVAAPGPRRGRLEPLLRGWQALRSAGAQDVGLVLVGSGSPETETGGLRHLGALAAPQLAAVISGAIAWLHPGQFQSSAVGAMDALACGTPIVVGVGTPMASIAEGNGLVLDTDLPSEWERAMSVLASDRDLRGRLSRRGLARLARREWSSGVESLARALRAYAAG